MHRVVILQKSMPQYREAFFTLLKERLAAENISLELVYGNMDEGRKDRGSINWATFKKNKYYKFGPLKLIWQPCLAEIRSADLVIVEQADKLLINYLLFLRNMFGKQRFAFWGSGRHMQSMKYGPRNLFKRIFLNRCDWWFAYTAGSKAFLIKNGYPADKITVVQNAVDTRQMVHEYNDIKEEELNSMRNRYGLQEGEKLLIYCGALYKKKRLDLLIETADRLVAAGHKLKLAIVGGGADEEIIRNAVLTRPYIIFSGPLFGREKAMIFKLSCLFLIPGAIGLAVLDSFAFETPIVTTNYKYHGVEFEYLVDGLNGVVTDNDLISYVEGISDLLNDKDKLDRITLNCRSEIEKYSNENMVHNFAEGIKFFFRENVNSKTHFRKKRVVF